MQRNISISVILAFLYTIEFIQYFELAFFSVFIFNFSLSFSNLFIYLKYFYSFYFIFILALQQTACFLVSVFHLFIFSALFQWPKNDLRANCFLKYTQSLHGAPMLVEESNSWLYCTLPRPPILFVQIPRPWGPSAPELLLPLGWGMTLGTPRQLFMQRRT